MLLHHLYKFFEQVLRIMRPWRGFGMVLYGKDREPLVPHPLQGLVVQIYLGEFDFCRIQRVRVNTKPMILGSDHHLTGYEIFNRLVGTPMAKF
jgi:hypothetical protein